MKPVYHHYETWEDFRNGMYEEDKNGRPERVQEAVRILSNTKLLYECMKRVTVEWPNATEQNLSNNIYSHRPFLGQAACNIHANIHEDETREAWGLLTDQQRIEANRIADIIFDEWQEGFLRKTKQDYQLSLFTQEEA